MTKQELVSAMHTDKLTVIDFYADWCGPCQMLLPYLDEVSQTMSDKVHIIKVNVDQERDLTKEFGVRSIPTMFLYKEGADTGESVDRGNLVTLIEKYSQPTDKSDPFEGAF